MKKITLSVEVRNVDVESAVAIARQSLPTWNVSIEDAEDKDGIENKYFARVGCTNCGYVLIAKFTVGTLIPTEQLCPACGCKTGRKA